MIISSVAGTFRLFSIIFYYCYLLLICFFILLDSGYLWYWIWVVFEPTGNVMQSLITGGTGANDSFATSGCYTVDWTIIQIMEYSALLKYEVLFVFFSFYA